MVRLIAHVPLPFILCKIPGQPQTCFRYQILRLPQQHSRQPIITPHGYPPSIRAKRNCAHRSIARCSSYFPSRRYLPHSAETATVAEKFDNLLVSKFYHMLTLGMFVRMLNAQIAATGESAALLSAREAAEAAFTARNAELDMQLKYSVIPIQKLVRVQLGSALLAADFAQSGS